MKKKENKNRIISALIFLVFFAMNSSANAQIIVSEDIVHESVSPSCASSCIGVRLIVCDTYNGNGYCVSSSTQYLTPGQPGNFSVTLPAARGVSVTSKQFQFVTDNSFDSYDIGSVNQYFEESGGFCN